MRNYVLFTVDGFHEALLENHLLRNDSSKILSENTRSLSCCISRDRSLGIRALEQTRLIFNKQGSTRMFQAASTFSLHIRVKLINNCFAYSALSLSSLDSFQRRKMTCTFLAMSLVIFPVHKSQAQGNVLSCECPPLPLFTRTTL